MDRFDEFLQVFTWYLCSRCTRGAPHHDPQDTSDGTGRHAHNGEILQYLGDEPVTADRIFAAYNLYNSYAEPRNIQRPLIKRYKNPAANAVPDTATAVAVQRIIEHRHSTWIRHGAELPEVTVYDTDKVFPEPHTRHTVGEQVTQNPNLERYAVDLERFPFQTCSKHELDHHSGAPWFYTAGYIAVPRFGTLGGSLHRSRDRDHLYAHSSIAQSQWIWIFRNTDIRAVEPAVQREQQSRIRAAGLPWIHERTVLALHKLLNHLDNYAEAQRWIR